MRYKGQIFRPFSEATRERVKQRATYLVARDKVGKFRIEAAEKRGAKPYTDWEC